MSIIQYKTRGNTSPQGKPRVWFTCHPDDFSSCFEMIAEEILNEQNCAIWYETERDDNSWSEILEEDLAQMQLFVVPITTSLLTKASRTLDKEIPFAIKHHIPILPIIQEAGLDELFYSRIGDIQYLDRQQQDLTAIPYREKLKRYLNSVLIGDELATKIRAAFDSYIFLSYRKKDRKYAQELMRLIHQNDFCRDIAIWYDEFLTPGEGFNAAISDAIEKSSLFAMAVTPNLINEPNYVLSTEYPMARQLGKQVIPAEMVSTDSGKLKEKFDGIPESISASNDQALRQALIKGLKSVALQREKGNLQHDFFIGLAYLGGVDVEVDHNKAVNLITGAADSGLVEAIDKLVSMYTTGEGVSRDLHTAAAWLEKLVDKRDKDYKQAPNSENGALFFSSLKRLGEAWVDMNQYQEAGKTFEKMASLSEEIENEFPSERSKRNIIISYGYLGSACLMAGNLTNAHGYYERSLDECLKLASEIEEADCLEDLAFCYGNLGNLSMTGGNYSAARDYYQKHLDLAQKMISKDYNYDSQFRMANSYCKLGDANKEAGNLGVALQCFQKNLEISESLEAENPTTESRLYHTISLERMGDISCVRDDYASAQRYYERCINLCRELLDETGMVAALEGVITASYHLGNIFRDRGDNLNDANWHQYCVSALDYYEKGLAMSKDLYEKTNSLKSVRYMMSFYNGLGQVHYSMSELSTAYNCYLECLTLSKAWDDVEDIEYKHDLIITYNALGDLSLRIDDPDKTIEWYEAAYSICNKVAEETGLSQWKLALAEMCDKLSACYDMSYNKSMSRKYKKKARSLRLKQLFNVLEYKSEEKNIRRRD